MRSNAAANQPAEETARSVSGVSGKPLRLQTKATFGSIEHRLCGLALVVGARGLNVDDDRHRSADPRLRDTATATFAAIDPPLRAFYATRDDE
jgi:hypothetical protein